MFIGFVHIILFYVVLLVFIWDRVFLLQVGMSRIFKNGLLERERKRKLKMCTAH
jgi:hypothetical protein